MVGFGFRLGRPWGQGSSHLDARLAVYGNRLLVPPSSIAAPAQRSFLGDPVKYRTLTDLICQ